MQKRSSSAFNQESCWQQHQLPESHLQFGIKQVGNLPQKAVSTASVEAVWGCEMCSTKELYVDGGAEVA